MQSTQTLRSLKVSLAVLGALAAVASCGGSDGGGSGSGGTPSAGASAGGAGQGGSSGTHQGTSATAGTGGSNVAGSSASAGSSGAASGGSAGASAGSAGTDSGGVPSDAGSAGDDAGAGGGPPPDCNDDKESTVDFYKPAYGCGHLIDSNPNDGQSWIIYDAGFQLDPKTSTAWFYQYTPPGVTQAQASTFCATLTIGKLSGFRMPTIDDARNLAYRCPPTQPGGTCPIHDATCLNRACGTQSPACDSCLGNGKDYLNPDAPLASAFYHTSSMCPDCAAPDQEWAYVRFNGNFGLQDPSDPAETVCVLPNLPDAVP